MVEGFGEIFVVVVIEFWVILLLFLCYKFEFVVERERKNFIIFVFSF